MKTSVAPPSTPAAPSYIDEAAREPRTLGEARCAGCGEHCTLRLAVGEYSVAHAFWTCVGTERTRAGDYECVDVRIDAAQHCAACGRFVCGRGSCAPAACDECGDCFCAECARAGRSDGVCVWHCAVCALRHDAGADAFAFDDECAAAYVDYVDWDARTSEVSC